MDKQSTCPHSLIPHHVPYIMAVLRTMLKPNMSIRHHQEECRLHDQCRELVLAGEPENATQHSIHFKDTENKTDSIFNAPISSGIIRFGVVGNYHHIYEKNPNANIIAIHTICNRASITRGLDPKLTQKLMHLEYDPTNHDEFVKSLYSHLTEAATIWRGMFKPGLNSAKAHAQQCKLDPKYPILPWEQVEGAPIDMTPAKKRRKATKYWPWPN